MTSFFWKMEWLVYKCLYIFFQGKLLSHIWTRYESTVWTIDLCTRQFLTVCKVRPRTNLFLQNGRHSNSPNVKVALFLLKTHYLKYRRLTRFGPPLTRFGPPIISSISELFYGRETCCILFWYTHIRLTAESIATIWLMWLKSLCSWVKARQRWAQTSPTTVATFFVKRCMTWNFGAFFRTFRHRARDTVSCSLLMKAI